MCYGHEQKHSKFVRQALAGAMATIALLCAAEVSNAHPNFGGGRPPVEGVNTRKSLDAVVEGEISSRCQLGDGHEIDFGDLTISKQVETNLGLYCNVPFELFVRARNGGLNHQELPGGQGGFSGSLSYGLSVDVPVLDPNARTVSGRFESAQLRNGVSISSQNGIARGGAALKIRTGQVQGHGLLAGQYSETIFLTIAPRM